MNRRGLGLIEILGIIAIAIIVLFIVFSFLGKVGIISSNFFSIIPDFYPGTPGVKDVQILRYLIDKNTVEYYDGIKWNSFNKQGAAELGDKKVSYKDVTDQFYNYFYGL